MAEPTGRVSAAIRTWAIAVALMSPSFSHARVFSYGKENLAAYIRGGGMMSRLGADAFQYSSGASTVFSSGDAVAYNLMGEIGGQFSVGSAVLRIGVEMMRPQIATATGKNAGGTDLMTVTSSVFVLHPNLALEYYYSATGRTRFFFLLGAGMAQVTLDNKYVFTASSPYGKADYTEQSEVWSYSGQVGVGFETHFTDSSTFSMDFGYRYLPVTGLKHKLSNDTLAQGAVSKGDAVLNQDNSTRSLDLGGLQIGMMFRFYIDIL